MAPTQCRSAGRSEVEGARPSNPQRSPTEAVETQPEIEIFVVAVETLVEEQALGKSGLAQGYDTIQTGGARDREQPTLSAIVVHRGTAIDLYRQAERVKNDAAPVDRRGVRHHDCALDRGQLRITVEESGERAQPARLWRRVVVEDGDRVNLVGNGVDAGVDRRCKPQSCLSLMDLDTFDG